MTRISAKHWETIINVIHTANAHLEEFDTFRKKVLEVLQNSMHTDDANFFLFDEKMNPYNPVAIRTQEKYLKLYQSHFFRFNHFDPTFGCIPLKPAVADRNLFQFAEFKKSYIYNEFFKPQNIQRQLVLYLKSGQKLLGFIGLHRCNQKSVFRDWEVTMAERIAPLLSRSLEKAQAFQQTKSDQAYFKAILNRTAVGVLLLNMNLEPILFNKMARELFSRMKKRGMAFRCPEDNNRSIPEAAYQSCQELKNRLPKIHHLLAAPTLQTNLKLAEDDVFTIRTELFDHPAAGMPKPLFLVTFDKKQPQEGRINEYKLRNEMGFTKREIELVHYLFKGLKNHEIAELLCITEGTVKNHLRNIFEKMGVTNRTSLIYEILSPF